jgi:hypothetical protein
MFFNARPLGTSMYISSTNVEKRCFKVNHDAGHIPNYFCDKHDSETYIIQNRCKIFTVINSWDLTVATCHKSCSENPVSLHFEYPFIFDASTINWDIFSSIISQTPLFSISFNSLSITFFHLIWSSFCSQFIASS